MCRSRISHAGTGETVRTPPYHSCAVCAVGAGVEVLAHAGEDRLDPRPRRAARQRMRPCRRPERRRPARSDLSVVELRGPACRTVDVAWRVSCGTPQLPWAQCRKIPLRGREPARWCGERGTTGIRGSGGRPRTRRRHGHRAVEAEQGCARRGTARVAGTHPRPQRTARGGGPGPLAGRRLPLLGRRMDGAARPAGSRLEHEGLPRCADGLPAAPGDRRHATHGTG